MSWTPVSTFVQCLDFIPAIVFVGCPICHNRNLIQSEGFFIGSCRKLARLEFESMTLAFRSEALVESETRKKSYGNKKVTHT